MTKYKTIYKLFESWGKSKKEIPQNNNALKLEILSKLPTRQNRLVLPKRSSFIWLPFSFTALAVFVLLFNGTSYLKNTNEKSSQSLVQTNVILDTGNDSISYTNNNKNISDDREFLKVQYSSTLRTRKVSELRIRVENIIHSFNGRVDRSNGGEKIGYVDFAIPKEKLESFKLEIKSLVGTRFYDEYINSQNFLPQKQIIEKNQKQNKEKLNILQSDRSKIIGNHNNNIAFYEAEIISKNTEINSLNLQYQFSATLDKTEILNRINKLRTEISNIQVKIENENIDYKSKLNKINSQIKSVQNNLNFIEEQDVNLINTVGTVDGSISLKWVSLWEMADAYLPGPILAWVFILAAITTFVWYRYIIKKPYNSFNSY